MHYKLFTAITTDIASVTDGQLVAAHLQLRDRMLAGQRPVSFLNELYNMTLGEMVRRERTAQ